MVTTAQLPTPRQQALALAKIGVRIVPLYGIVNGFCTCKKGAKCTKSAGKHPRILGWQNEATTEQSIINGWFNRWPNMNFGIAAGPGSGVLILDVDGEEGRQSLVGKELPETPTSKSGREDGGNHYYFKDPGIELPNEARILPGLDIRTDGGQAVAPPSIHKSGNRYAWVISPFEMDFAPCPQWIIDAALKPHEEEKPPEPQPNNMRSFNPDKNKAQRLASVLKIACDKVSSAPQGKRHDVAYDQAFWMGGFVSGEGLDQFEAERKLFDAGMVFSDADPDERRKTIRDGLEEGKKRPLRLEEQDRVNFNFAKKARQTTNNRIDPDTGEVSEEEDETSKKEETQPNTVVVIDNAYHYYTLKYNEKKKEWEPKFRKLTNFIFEPYLFLKNSETAYFRGKVTTELKKEFEIELSLDAFIGVSNFNKALAMYYTLSYTGNTSDLGAVKDYISKTVPDLKEIRVEHTLGYTPGFNGWMISENEILTSSGVIDALQSGFAYSPLHFTPKTFFDTSHLLEGKELAKPILLNLPAIADHTAFQTVTGWFFANPFKPIITNSLQTKTGASSYWPYLFVMGPAGSGKSNLIRLYQELFGVASASGSVTGATPYATLTALGYSQNLPLFLDEYNRKSIENARRCDQLDTHLRDGYNLIPAFKGNQNLTTTRFERYAPVVIAGESFTEDTAIRGRILGVEKPGALEDYHVESYKTIQKCNKAAFATAYAQWVMAQDIKIIEGAWYNAIRVSYEQVEEITQNTSGHSELDRVAANIAVCIFGLEMFRDFSEYCGVSQMVIDYRELITSLLRVILDDNGEGRITQRVKNQADYFVEWCCNHVQELKHCVDWRYEGDGEYIYISFPHAFEAFEGARAKIRQGTFDPKAVKVQLKGRDYVALTSEKGQLKFQGQNKRAWKIEANSARGAGLEIASEPPPEINQDDNLSYNPSKGR